jgi:predicted DNA binding CopG/RHH family protein
MEKPMNTNNLPQSDSIQELAQFWDTHDLTDFEADLEEVTEAVFDRETTVMIHLSSEDAVLVNEIAKAKGLNDAELIREWVVEKVHGL